MAGMEKVGCIGKQLHAQFLFALSCKSILDIIYVMDKSYL